VKKNIKHIEDKNLTFEDFSFLLPKKYEKVFLLLHAFFIPYVAGLLFIFFYIAEVNIDLFSSLLDNHSFFLTWCIGYQIVMFIFLLGLMIKSLTIMHPKEQVLLKF